VATTDERGDPQLALEVPGRPFEIASGVDHVVDAHQRAH
jgi:hypothetical protein